MLGLVLAAAIIAAPPEAAVHADELTDYQTMLTKAARDADANFAGGPCETSTVEPLSRRSVKIADQPDFAALNERLRVSGCGHSSVQNIHVGRFGGAPPWKMVVGLPGDSIADTPLQQSTLPAALGQARTELPEGCNGQKLGDVYVAARPGRVAFPATGAKSPPQAEASFTLRLPADVEAQRDKLDLSKSWVEVWPFEVCGQDRTIAVVFMPLRSQVASAYLFLPIWRQILANGPGARPAPAPES